jgi:PAS domain S-box-containing protein
VKERAGPPTIATWGAAGAAAIALLALAGRSGWEPGTTALSLIVALLACLLLWLPSRFLRQAEGRLVVKAAETAVAEELVRGLFDLAPDAVLLVDEQGRVLRMNERAEEVFGWPAEELVGQSVDVLVPDRLVDRHVAGRTGYWSAPDRRLLGQAAGLPLQRRDGTEQLVEISLGPMETPAGRRVIVAVRDITARRRAQDELERQMSEVQALNTELEAFSYSVSHDLRTPLRAIDGFSRMLEEDHSSALDPEGRRLLGIVRERGLAMTELIDDLLRFSRLSRESMEPDDVDMAALARATVESLRAGLPEDRVEVAIGRLPPAHGDPRLLRHVWENYLGNAFKFSAGRERPQIQVQGRSEEGEVVYEVRDNGVGFDPQYADKLFVVFQRLHASESFEGTGVGLALVQRIVHRHGGRVWADGRSDEGASFYFSLPAPGGRGEQEAVR